ncbi:DNase I-like protein [Cryphonectria parasitica EP155]|uniref:DNase I-like protein n=1 Tax=Cryphonectria parasitica (strain ATCC 38755 / EP155) TaxID=660469 RepID=A0A9P5CRI8_CRYP1|nr:DNase I-like protein [Cryphonectria parasitica EP155]KAF3768619.1 DNase I-like protein [Cryphonectria parasitica EP155]
MDRGISPPPLKRQRVQSTLQENLSSQPRSQSSVGHGLGPTSVRVFTWNINGIQPFLPASTLPITSFFKPVGQHSKSGLGNTTTTKEKSLPDTVGSPLRAFLQRHCWPEILFLQELKISPSDSKTPATLLHAVNSPLPSENGQDLAQKTRYKLDFNLPRDKHNARGFGGKLYGVGTLLREDFASRHVATVRHASWDHEGRVTIVELGQEQTKGGDRPRPLALINIYAVNGTSAPYRSPDTGRALGTRHDHKLRVHERLRDECLGLEGRGFDVVIAGDLNVARGRLDGWPNLRTYPQQHCLNRADFNNKFFGDEDNARSEASSSNNSDSSTTFDGVDAFRAIWGNELRYTYHPRSGDEWGASCDRVDLIIVSKSLFDSGRVLQADILDSPQERGTSDHVPLWVKLRLCG